MTFQNHTNRPLTDFGGKTSIFSHPVYLFLREFSLQDFRGGSLGDSQDVSLHSLRHWLATRMKERGVNLVDAQGILGHSSQSITYDLYGKGHAVGRLADVLKTALL
ncbi:tyrosine-type recombinase/integrase [Escherichia coli]|uniref:tyrosine-type recombinase/integrase n=1 Tax=Escherichia coli TaxID=562 RepID=UPI0027D95FF3|nr:tyrosine-type recombinase/integrase [Escherichia coli]